MYVWVHIFPRSTAAWQYISYMLVYLFFKYIYTFNHTEFAKFHLLGFLCHFTKPQQMALFPWLGSRRMVSWEDPEISPICVNYWYPVTNLAFSSITLAGINEVDLLLYPRGPQWLCLKMSAQPRPKHLRVSFQLAYHTPNTPLHTPLHPNKPCTHPNTHYHTP